MNVFIYGISSSMTVKIQGVTGTGNCFLPTQYIILILI